MSEADRQRWNHRYRSGEYVGRTHATELIRIWLPVCPAGKALDLACGSGRNSRFLADAGYDVSGIDISEVAIELASAASLPSDQRPVYSVQDLENPEIEDKYDVIIMVRYVNLDLLATLDTYLRPNGVLMVEEHLSIENVANLTGPKDPSFRVARGVLRARLQNFRVVHEFEDIAHDPDGNTVALSQIVARRP